MKGSKKPVQYAEKTLQNLLLQSKRWQEELEMALNNLKKDSDAGNTVFSVKITDEHSDKNAVEMCRKGPLKALIALAERKFRNKYRRTGSQEIQGAYSVGVRFSKKFTLPLPENLWWEFTN